MSKTFKKFQEDIVIPIKIGDTVKGGKFKNKPIKVKKIGKNDKGDITINDRPLLKVRLIKGDKQEGRDYKKEYKKFQSSPERIAYRAQLVKYNRDKGTYGNKDGKDASHKGDDIVGFEDASKNRSRKEKSRVKGYKKLRKEIAGLEGTTALTKKYKKETPGQKIKEAPLVVVGDRKYRERVLSYTSDFIDKTKIVDIDKKLVKGVLKKKITHKGKSHKFEKKLK